jgi:hypothetical protein
MPYAICYFYLHKVKKTMSKFRFEDLEIWRVACLIGDELDDISNRLENQKRWRYAEQLRGAALSISNNIAEGSGSSSKRFPEFSQLFAKERF